MNNDDIVKNDLIKEIRTFTDFDDVDWPPDAKFTGQRSFSIQNVECLTESFLSISKTCNAILEIGVLRDDPSFSSTPVFLNNKEKDTFYFGVDIEDRSSLNSTENNIFTLGMNSSNIQGVMDFVRSKGVDKFDYIFIDGWHSINQVLDDWKYTEFLADDGIVGFHDTNQHPGPKAFINALDPKKYYIDKKCIGENFEDWGIAFVKKKK